MMMRGRLFIILLLATPLAAAQDVDAPALQTPLDELLRELDSITGPADAASLVRDLQDGAYRWDPVCHKFYSIPFNLYNPIPNTRQFGIVQGKITWDLPIPIDILGIDPEDLPGLDIGIPIPGGSPNGTLYLLGVAVAWDLIDGECDDMLNSGDDCDPLGRDPSMPACMPCPTDLWEPLAEAAACPEADQDAIAPPDDGAIP